MTDCKATGITTAKKVLFFLREASHSCAHPISSLPVPPVGGYISGYEPTVVIMCSNSFPKRQEALS